MPRYDRNRGPRYRDETFTSPNPQRFYRSTRDKVFAGVCGGLAERFGWDSSILRILTIVFFFMSGVFPVVVVYLIAAMVVPRDVDIRRERTYSPEEEEFWREVSDRPRTTARSVRYKFMDLEERLRSLETSVTSDEWRLRKEFRDLEGR